MLDKLERHRKSRLLEITEYEEFVENLTSVTRIHLQDLNANLFKRCKYIIFPLNFGWHWFVLLYSAPDGEFQIMNSKHHPAHLGISKVYVSFIISISSTVKFSTI